MARVISLAVATLFLIGCAHKEAAPPPAAAKPGRKSTAEERQRFLTVVHKIQESPPKGYDPDVEWAASWLLDAADVPIALCVGTIPLTVQNEVTFNPGVVFLFGAGAFVIEHPELADNLEEVHFAAVMAVLDAYARERKRGHPSSPTLDEMAARARAGTLRAQIADWLRRCKRTS